jgi:hypothetical protein
MRRSGASLRYDAGRLIVVGAALAPLPFRLFSLPPATDPA